MPTSPQPKVWGYNGEATDSKTGLQYLRARYYSTCMSRFIQKDSWKGELQESVSLNRYAYCYNDPVNYSDASGNRRMSSTSKYSKKKKKTYSYNSSSAYIKRYSNPVKPTPWKKDTSGGGGARNSSGSSGYSGGSGSSGSSGGTIRTPSISTPWIDPYQCALIRAGRNLKEALEELNDDLLEIQDYNMYVQGQQIRKTRQLKEDIQNFDKSNTDENVVLNSNYFSSYKGVLFIRHNIPTMTSCGLPGVVFLDKDEKAGIQPSIDTVKHEFGHTEQAKELGVIDYIMFVARPSLNGFNSNLTSQEYYSQPWERDADIRGGVDRSNPSDPFYSFGSEEAAQAYFDSIINSK